MHRSTVRVLIVEDHQLLIDGLHILLANQTRFQVVGAVANGTEVYEACLRLAPDLILLDLGLPGMDGIDVIHLLRKRWPHLHILVFSSNHDERRRQQALAAGAAGFVSKGSPRQALLDALCHVANGQRYVAEAAGREAGPEGASAGTTAGERLTLRERQVLKLVAEGKRNREIAILLSLSIKTVETHRLNLMRKLDAHNGAELSTWARRIGLLEC